MIGEPNLLGEYVRARRELVTPDQVGLPVSGVRRVPGLRREEVALLAGISADYYLRLEQGRDRNPSAQVLEAIARALRLDEAATAYLLRLGAERPARHRRPDREDAPDGVVKLVAALALPAIVESRHLDVLATNPAATALSPRLVAGANRLRDAFLDPAERTLYPDWEGAASSLVAGFRETVGTDAADPRRVALVDELSQASPEFARLWARHDVAVCEGAPIRLDHPRVGGLVLNRERLGVSGAAGQKLVIFHPDPESDSAAKLALLAAGAAA